MSSNGYETRVKRLPVSSVVFRAEAVGNMDRRFGSDTVYFPFHVIDSNGEAWAALATRDELNRMIARADKNPEDIGEPAGLLRRIFAWVLR